MNGRASPTGELLDWLPRDVRLEPGDEIRVRVVEAPSADEPNRTSVREERESAREIRRDLYEKLKGEFDADAQ